MCFSRVVQNPGNSTVCSPSLIAHIANLPPVEMEITPKLLKEYCKKDGLYSTPHLNDKLYLHYKGFREIKHLEGYTGLKVLWLEGNGLGQISGLEAQTEMRTLYLQENLIEKIENLGHMVS